MGTKVTSVFPNGEPFDAAGKDDLRGPLVDWLVRRDNPYFARSFANRLWFYLFSRGIVNPVDDFRELNPPSHPGLIELLAGEFEAEFHRQQVVGIPIASLTNTVNKQVRIRRLGPYLSSGRLQFKANSPSTRLLVDQMRDFPAGAHDDGPDAAEMALRLALEFVGNDRADDGLGSRLPLELR